MSLKSQRLMERLGYDLFSDDEKCTVYKQRSNWITFYKGIQPYFSFNSYGAPGFVDITIVTAFLLFCEEQGPVVIENNDLGYDRIEVIRCI